MRELIREAKRIQRRAMAAYREQRVTLRVREMRRETDEEITEGVAGARHG